MKRLWVSEHKPTKISEYVFRDKKLKIQVDQWIKDQTIPHLLLTGSPGTGKSALANVLLHELGMNPGDVMEINASDETSVDVVRTKVINFAGTMAFGAFKIIILEEFDHMSINGQSALRRVMEDYADVTRFILTGNYRHKIIPAILSRVQEIQIQKIDETDFITRVATILEAENVDFEVEHLDAYIRASYPDLRRCINMLQMNTSEGKLLAPSDENVESSDYLLSMVTLFKEGRILEARKLICSQAKPEEYEDIYKFLYRNLSLFGTTQDMQDQALIIIRDGLYKHAIVGDPEINLAACLCQLGGIK